MKSVAADSGPLLALFNRTDTPVPGSFHDALAISQKYKTVPFDFADASVAELAARRGLSDVLTIDSDFNIYRDARGKALHNVLRLTALRR